MVCQAVVVLPTSFFEFHLKLYSDLWRAKPDKCQSFIRDIFEENAQSLGFFFFWAYVKIYEIFLKIQSISKYFS